MREKIKKASIQLFGEKGFKETSIQDIVRSLEVTKGTFYYYFSSKEELLTEIHFDYIDELVRNIEELSEDETKSNRDKLVGVVYLMVMKIKHHRSSANIIFREMRHVSAESYTEIARKRNQVRERTEEIVREGIAAQEFRSDLNPPIVTLAILGVINWSYQWFNPEGKYSDEEVAGVFVDMVLHGIQS
ncbi:TetR/AcrR family transcriptional regulator [Salicibibacter cibarius]|uniref:TetR/AcrR family transcriptional regulator n=1 Tax=Salicibibacter cibarius TaxID=2743000 RepID=A0A7T6Z5W3_9BACI|nr:TetR/AcrR family transcriptional regulator [Salicibibacter cibarius]QQK77455.1 TetR/AcrR family transcriptional regulator [Salicibibacter cibarius]